MSDFVVSARKYRPTSFDEVVGQSSITLTLQNAIKSNQLAQSFLFCGPRGIGKTTCARILAKEINGNTDINDFSFNIFELDAASNNSVEDIRNLTEQVRIPPQIGKYKVYIIDEVHMLSQSAFNAFLKTLEEPPKHAKFILATTEKHKIIPTILSRCQIFDFKRVGIHDISAHLAFVAKNEGINAEEEALNLIAQKADGAIRDSLSLFDRLVSFSENNLTYLGVIKHLNILDYDYYFNITSLLLSNDISGLLNIFNEILDNGFDGNHFINGLAVHIRDLLVSKDESTIKLLEKGDVLEKRYLEQSSLCELSFLVKALEMCNECDLQYRSSNNQRLLVELCLMRISSIGSQSIEKKNSKSFIVSTYQKESVNTKEKQIDPIKNDEVKENQDISIPNMDITAVETKKSKTISISEAFNDIEKKEKEELNTRELNVDLFTNNEMQEAWKEIIVLMKENGKSNLAITLGVHLPILHDNFEIELPLSNSSQIELIEEEKYNLLNFLRTRLSNDHIEIKTKVIEGDQNNIPYTNRDKFNKMLEGNKHLESLRIKLELDPDY